MSTFIEAKDVILGVFKKQWDITQPGGPVNYDDKPFTTPTGAQPWARVILRHSDGGQSSLTGPLEGAKRFTNEGTVFIQVMQPVGKGYDKLYGITQALYDAYCSARHPNVWFRNVRIEEVPTRGPWAQVNVMANFEYDRIIKESQNG